MQEVLKKNMSNINNKSIYAYYHQLLDKNERNRKMTMKLDAFYVISDLAKFSHKSFWSLNHSKKYKLEVKNINTRPSNLREIIHMQKFVIINWQL